MKHTDGKTYILVEWTIGDVQSVRPDLTDEQAFDVLQQAVEQHDATVGINWEALEYHAVDMFGCMAEEFEDQVWGN